MRSWVRFPLWPPPSYWLGRCQYNVTGWDRSHGLPALSCVRQQLTLLDDSLGLLPRCSLVADENIKKPNKQAQGKNLFNIDKYLQVEIFSTKACMSLWNKNAYNTFFSIIPLVFTQLLSTLVNKGHMLSAWLAIWITHKSLRPIWMVLSVLTFGPHALFLPIKNL